MAHLRLQQQLHDESSLPPPSRPPSPPPINMFPPNSDTPMLSSHQVPYPSLMGTWHVVASTLPLWNDKKNVTITYSPLAGHPATTFDDLVQYNKRSDPVGKHASSVKGVDKLEEGTGSRWKWRGKGWLMIASSHWQLLGYRLLPPSSVAASAAAPPDDPEWVVTYFSATMFTPAGLDIYSRTKTMSDAFVDRLVGEIKNLGGEVAECCNKGDGMFRIPHD